MLCPHCRVRTRKGFPFCLRCGNPLPGADLTAATPSTLVPASGDPPVTLAGPCTTLGRGPGNDVTVADRYASRNHARIWREPTGYRLEDLDSLNGTFVNDERLAPGGSRSLRDFDVVGLGPNARFRVEQPRGEDIGGKTMISTEGTVVAAAAAATRADDAGTGLNLKPRRRSGWALKRVSGTGDTARYVLRSTSTSAYLQLTERDRFLWELMDGEHSVRDLLLAYASAFGQLALARIQQLIDQLHGAGLLAPLPGEVAPGKPGAGTRVVAALTRMELAVSGIDRRMDSIYRRLGWRFFTRVGMGLVAVAGIGGLLAFAVASQRARLLDVGGAGAVGVVLALGAYTVSLVVHEMAHALAVKSYGRKVPRGGLMVMMGMPYAFVDTTDMWFEGRGARILVSLAGPVATAAMAAFFAVGAAVLPSRPVAGVCFQVAFALYVNTLFNFNPLIPLDGYYALSDWLGRPRLREEATAYFTRGLWADLAHGRMPGGGKLGLAIYGLLSVVGMILFLLLGVFTWTSRIGGLAHEHLPAPLDTMVEVAGLLLIFFPVWYAPVVRVTWAIRRRLRREESLLEPDTVAAIQA
ncbi:MAG: FHA domain-containing protein [Candidatus Dormibacteria bacterium]